VVTPGGRSTAAASWSSSTPASPNCSLLDDLAAQQQAGRAVEVVVVGADRTASPWSATLAGRTDMAAIHLIGHGATGVADLGRPARCRIRWFSGPARSRPGATR
jgi:hypothetical protein